MLKRVLLLFNTTRTLSGPPSTGAAIAMDGGEVWVDTRKVQWQGLSERPVGLQSHARTSTSRARARGGMPAGRASDHGLICT